MIVNDFNEALRRSLPALMLAGLFWQSGSSLAALHPRDHAVELTANIKSDPPEIALQWRGDQYARDYIIRRKARNAEEWAQIGTAAGHETWFVDRNVEVGRAYEYQVVKEGTLQYTGYGYIYAGIQLPEVEERGRLILLVESSVAEPLSMELKRLEFDLIGDGWQVVRRDVPRSAKVTEIKKLIRELYVVDPGRTRALFLFGNIPVPYSGDLTPDEHADHQGAWPADVFYADVDGQWTDSSVTSTGAQFPRNHNLPGDGKFDQSEIPSKVELQVGRVDLSRMTCFLNKLPSRNEVDLLRGYLEKDHVFRHGRLPPATRGLIFDRIGLTLPEPLSTMAWRNFAPFAGSSIDVIEFGEYFPKVSQGLYLWTSVVAGGGMTHSDGVGSSDGFALHDVNAVFTMFSGSYYGDWDVESNFLRAALGASGRVLTAMYSGQPQWVCHTMALGEPVGAAAKITQDNGETGIYVPHNRGAGQVHVALHGDPTLRAHPIASPQSLKGTEADGGLMLEWNASTAPGLAGYILYEASSAAGPYRRLTPSPLDATSFLVHGGGLDKFYMVKAIALTSTPSGSYWNISQGSFFPEPDKSTTAELPTAPRNLVVTEIRPESISMKWVSGGSDQTGFEVERMNPDSSEFLVVGVVSREQWEFVDRSLPTVGMYRYRVRAVNAAGKSGYSNTISSSTRSGTAEFIGIDTETRGQWVGKFGSKGQLIPEIIEEAPPGFSMVVSNVITYVPGYLPDPRAPQIPGSSLGSGNCWVHFRPFALHLNFADEQAHQVTLYIASFSRQDPVLDVEIYDAVTRTLLDRRRFDDVNEGVYLSYLLRRQVIVQIVPVYPNQGEVYGLFFDEPEIPPVQITPSSGEFMGKTLIEMSNSISEAEIRYTTDGSEPGPGSDLYTEPFWIYASAHFRARAFREGYPPSAVTEAHFENSMESRIAFLRWDEELGGNWTDKAGADGYWVAGGRKEVPFYAELSIAPSPHWSWNDNAQEERASFKDATGEGRVAAGWYSPDEVVLDLAVFDTKERAVSLYFMDWDRQNRVQQVEVLDGAGAVRDTFTVENFINGKHLILRVKGFVKVRIKKVSGVNAILNGIFFDPAPVAVNVGAPVPLAKPLIADGSFWFSVSGIKDQRFCLDKSTDLHLWSCLSTNVFEAATFQMSVPFNRQEPNVFLRGHIVP